MPIYIVMEPAGSRAVDHDRTAYVRDGFSVIALLVPVIWLLWYRLWIEAALVFAAGLALGAVGQALHANPVAVLALSLLIGLYIALEGPALRIAALRRRGWRERGVVNADNEQEAELRHLADGLFSDPHEEAMIEARAADPRTQRGTVGPALGLLDYPGSR